MRLGRRRAGRLPGAHVELALVQRAFDLVAFEEAVAQARMAVRADVVGGVDLAADAVQRDVAAGHDDADHVVLRQVVRRQRVDPVGVAHGGPQIG